MTELLVPPHHPTSRLDPAPTLAAATRPRSGTLTLGLDLTALGTGPAPWSGTAPRSATADEPRPEIDQQRVTDLARLAERAGVDFVAFDEDFALAPGGPRTPASRLDAARIVGRLAPATTRVGLVATLDTGHLDARHVRTALATLHAKSDGRVAWQVGASHARSMGETPQVWERLDRQIRAVTGAHASTGVAAGDRPGVVVRVASPAAAVVAGALADVARVEALDAQAARELRRQVRGAASAAGRDPDAVRVLVDVVVLLSADAASARARLDILADLATGEPPWRRTLSHLGHGGQLADLLEAWFTDGVVDGFTLVPGSLPHDARALAGSVVPVLRERGLLPALAVE